MKFSPDNLIAADHKIMRSINRSNVLNMIRSRKTAQIGIAGRQVHYANKPFAAVKHFVIICIELNYTISRGWYY